MTTPPLTSQSFQRAVYEGDPTPADHCAYCTHAITDEYFRVGGHLACSNCAETAQSLVPPDGHKVFVHALSYGAIAAVLGCIAYAMLTITTGWTIGYAAIGVGYLIGWSMRKAAKQHGGRRYQWAAAVLTYAAVSMAFIPIVWHADREEKAQQKIVSQQTPGSQGANGSAAAKADWSIKGLTGLAGALLVLLAMGLISPFVVLFSSVGSGLLNLFILFIGVRYAWQSMAVKTVDVEGPFEAVAAAGGEFGS